MLGVNTHPLINVTINLAKHAHALTCCPFYSMLDCCVHVIYRICTSNISELFRARNPRANHIKTTLLNMTTKRAIYERTNPTPHPVDAPAVATGRPLNKSESHQHVNVNMWGGQKHGHASATIPWLWLPATVSLNFARAWPNRGFLYFVGSQRDGERRICSIIHRHNMRTKRVWVEKSTTI